MASPLLVTKLHVPRRRRGLVPRPKLSDRLNRAAEFWLESNCVVGRCLLAE